MSSNAQKEMEFIFKARDKVSDKLGKMGAKMGTTGKKGTSAFKGISKSAKLTALRVKKITSSVSSLAGRLLKLTGIGAALGAAGGILGGASLFKSAAKDIDNIG